jgi:DNA-binding Lrp family transcriptional regulator
MFALGFFYVKITTHDGRGYRLQRPNQGFFVNVKKLNGSGWNPTTDLTSKHVYEVDLEEVFGKVAKFQTTNSKLHPKARKKLISLYAKIYEVTPLVMNIEFMSLVVEDYISRVEGHNINWARVIVCLPREKAWRESMEKMQKTSIKLELLKFSIGKVLCKFEGDVLMLKGKYVKQGCVNNS